MMSQRASIIIFLTGLVAFLTSLAAFFGTHDSWASLGKPSEVGHILVMIATLLTALIGALNIQMPRDSSKDYKDRVSDKKIEEINKTDQCP